MKRMGLIDEIGTCLDDSIAMQTGWLYWEIIYIIWKSQALWLRGFYKIDGRMRFFNEKGENVLNINAWFVGANYGYYSEDSKNIDTIQ